MKTGLWFGLGLGAALLAAACNMEQSGETLEQSELAATAPTQISGFALLASGHATFKDRAQISGGHVGVAPGSGDSITAGFDSKTALGRSTLGQRVVLKDRAALGDLFATTVVGTRGTYTSLSPYSAPPAQPSLPAFTAGSSNITVNSPTTLAAGNYGNITVNSTLTLSGGTYQIQNLTLNVNSTVQPSGATVLRVAGKITGSNNVRLGSTSPSAAGNLRIEVAGATDTTGGIVLGTDSILTALVVSRAAVSVNDRFVGSGVIAARDITLGIDARFTYAVGFECNTNAGCEDGNSCTTDTCQDMRCVHATAPNGSACTDDGNACTSDTCSSGSCSHPARANGTACTDDGNDCTLDTCSAGACTHPAVVNGTACADDGNVCTADACSNGACFHPAVPDSRPCPEDDDPCTRDECINTVCAHPARAVGDFCSTRDICNADGECVPYECLRDSDCNDGNTCTTDTCVLHMCDHDNIGDIPCGDRMACDWNRNCLPVDCNTDADCDDGNVCTTEVCTANTCVRNNLELGTECGPDLICSPGAVCAPADCGGDLGTCDDGNPCTHETCVFRHCFRGTFDPGFVCGEGLVCNEETECVPVECDTDVDCDDGNECTFALCQNHLCGDQFVDLGHSCGDDPTMECGPGAVCVPRECTFSSDCDDGNECTRETCALGHCFQGETGEGELCGDNGVCNDIEICVPIQCSTDAECDDGKICSTDTCVNRLCVHTQVEFGTECGANMVCGPSSECVPRECTFSTDCDDANACTSESCVFGHCFRGFFDTSFPCGDGGTCDGAGNCTGG